MNEQRFKFLLQELIDRNPFSVRAMLRIVTVEFTASVPTLAVTRESPPRMLVNLSFLGRHCRNDMQVKAVILHEFLHVLLRHTEDRRRLTPARHLAFDAVINAIIHRQCGPGFSSMMSEYYRGARGFKRLLRPMTPEESDLRLAKLNGRAPPDPLLESWFALYSGRLIADDIEALAEQFARLGAGNGPPVSDDGAAGEGMGEIGDLLGNHEELGQELPAELEEALDAAMKEMNGSGIWREPRCRGVGANPYEALVAGRNEALEQWRRKTLAVLRRHVEPDRRSRVRRDVPLEYRTPVLSPGDRRAFIRSLWSPFIPDAVWSSAVRRPEGTAQVYLDVSGSMDCEMPLIIALLGRLSRHIRRPFWAFSDEVAPASIERNRLRTVTTGGTSMACVLEHLARTRPAAAVVITDGYIEEVDRELLHQAAATRLHALVTRDGNCLALERAGIAYTQLDEVPS